MKIKTIFLLITMIVTTQTFFAQDSLVVKNPPIIIEPLVSNRGLYFQMILNKKLQAAQNFGFFSASGILAEWESSQMNEVMIQSYLTYQMLKGFTVNGGFHYTSVTGIRPTAGIMYTYTNPTWLLLIFPRIDLISKPNVETLLAVEFKPIINKNLKLYSRFQGTYVYNVNLNSHERSYVYLRVGMTYKEFTFGIGTNLDYYSFMKSNINSIGTFLKVELF